MIMPFRESTLKKWFPILLLLVLVLALFGERLSHFIRSPGQKAHQESPLSVGSLSQSAADHEHDEGSKHEGSDGKEGSGESAVAFPATAPQVDPVRQKRMAIFHYNEGNRFLREGKWEVAVLNYEKALKHDIQFPEVYVNMSNALLKGGQYDRARKALDTLQTQAPNHPALHYNLACYYSLTHQEGKSLDALKRALSFGFKQTSSIASDPDLANLRNTEAYQQWAKAR